MVFRINETHWLQKLLCKPRSSMKLQLKNSKGWETSIVTLIWGYCQRLAMVNLEICMTHSGLLPSSSFIIYFHKKKLMCVIRSIIFYNHFLPQISFLLCLVYSTYFFLFYYNLWTHSYDILGARMLWKPKEARIL